MIAVIDNYRRTLSRAWKRSGVGDFLAWWYHELVSVLPERVRTIVDHPKELVYVTSDGTKLTIEKMIGANRDVLLVQQLNGDAEVDGPAIRSALEGFDDAEPLVILGVDPAYLLRKRVAFPKAAIDNLHQVFGFEMDRHTPFNAKDVYYDCRVIDETSGGAQVNVELVLVPRANLDPVLQALSQRNISVDGIDLLEADGALAGVNLLPPDSRPRRVNRRLRINVALGLLALALMYAVMWQSITIREQQIAEYQERIADVRSEALQVAELKKRLTDAREAATFLRGKRDEAPALVEVLNEVTRILPDDTYLQRLQLRENELQLTGQAPESSELIRLLEASPLLATPSPRGSIPRDPQTGKERFTIEAMLRTKTEGSDGPAAENG